MGEATKIEWCDATFNAWVGCTKVSPACDHCYAEGWAKRTGHPELWQGDRRRTTSTNWREPIKWNKRAGAEGRRLRVFCSSLADVFDNQVPTRWRDDLWHRIEQTPNLDWLLLTKRPQNIAKMLPDPRTGVKPWGDGWPNVWLGTTVENQTEADRRIPHLLAASACVRFLSCEPLLGPVDLSRWLDRTVAGRFHAEPILDWIITGGESGPGARPAHPHWFRSLRDQCQAAGVPFFFKQWGEWAPGECAGNGQTRTERVATLWEETAKVARWDFGTITPKQGEELHTDDAPDVWRLGKKQAGAMLDGREWREFPTCDELLAKVPE